MRRKDREITNPDEIIEIIKKCDVCRIALFDEKYPYILPLNFGFSYSNHQEGSLQLELFFHCAHEGKKLSLIQQNPYASFEMDCAHKLITGDKDCSCTMEYESVCGNGEIVLINDQKKEALTHLMGHYSEKPTFEFDSKELQSVTVFKLVVHSITGKRLKRS